MKTGIKVADAMTKRPIFISPEDSIELCCDKMLEQKVGSVIVKKEDKILGIISEKDIITRVVTKKLDPKTTLAKDVMSTKLITISSNQDLFDALQLMKIEKIRKLPVVDNEKFVGFLTTKDVLRLQPTLLEIYLERMNIREHEEKFSKRYSYE